MLLLAVGLAMDAFAVSICKGLSVKKLSAKECLICGVWFGAFQGIMPLIGYIIGSSVLSPSAIKMGLSVTGFKMVNAACFTVYVCLLGALLAILVTGIMSAVKNRR